MSAKLLRVGVFYDGNYFFHVSNYYNYVHRVRSRISIDGLHRFILEYLADQEEIDECYCRITDAHYFRGRLSSHEAREANRLFSERLFEDILINEGVITHYLPLRYIDGRYEEKGIDTWMALEAYELAIHKKFDVLVLIACDGDYVPLVQKLNTLGTRVMVLGWDFEYTDSRNGRLRTTTTSIDLLREATYPVAMHRLINGELDGKRFNIEDLFVNKDPDIPQTEGEQAPGQREQSFILSLKEGYGFIAKPPNNLFFHWSDVIGADFNELEAHDPVEFSIAFNERGQEIAVDVEKLKKE